MNKKLTRGNSLETMIADQKFKLTESDGIIRNFYFDCLGDINSQIFNKED